MRDNDGAARVNDAASLCAALGLSIDARGVDGEDLGWVEGYFEPLGWGGPAHAVPVGVLSLVLAASMELAIQVALPAGARVGMAKALTTTPEGPVSSGTRYAVRAEVVGLRTRAANVEARLIDEDGRVRARAEATYLVARD